MPAFDPFPQRAPLDEGELLLGLIELSGHDLVELRQTIARSPSQIAALAVFNDVMVASDRLADAFLTNKDAKQLAPLQNALKMGRGACRKATLS